MQYRFSSRRRVALWLFVLSVLLLKDAPSVLAADQAPPGDVAQLLRREENLNEKCQGGSGDSPATQNACTARDAVVEQLHAKGWCYGPLSAPMYQQRWMPCSQAQVVESSKIPAQPPSNGPDLNQVGFDAATTRLSTCLNHNADQGDLTSFDGGKSAMRLLWIACKSDADLWVKYCQLNGSAEKDCNLNGAILAQAALRTHGR